MINVKCVPMWKKVMLNKKYIEYHCYGFKMRKLATSLLLGYLFRNILLFTLQSISTNTSFDGSDD